MSALPLRLPSLGEEKGKNSSTQQHLDRRISTLCTDCLICTHFIADSRLVASPAHLASRRDSINPVD